jgi:hypothetical protein
VPKIEETAVKKGDIRQGFGRRRKEKTKNEIEIY